MRRAWLLALALCACADPTKLPPEQRGRAVYATYDCRRCHRVGYEGGDMGPDLTFVGFRKSADFLELWLKDPSGWQPDTLMPRFQLSDDARRALAAYLATLRGQAYREAGAPWDKAPPAGDPLQRGAEIYRRAGCVSCHGREGKGGYANNNVAGGKVPGLRRVREGFSRAELIARIAKGAVPLPADPAAPAPRLGMPAWGEVLTPGEIEAVADYLLSLAPEAAADDW